MGRTMSFTPATLKRLKAALVENGPSLPDQAAVTVLAGDVRAALRQLSRPQSETRQIWLSYLFGTHGNFNRASLTGPFDISTAQAALDIAEWLKTNPNRATYNPSTKRYERTIALLTPQQAAD